MPRYRSRQIETESVNQRLLRRGAVTRQHISRWAVGATELAPGVVGDTHLHPTTIERIREIATGIGAGQLLIVEVEGQSFASGGAYVDATSIVYQQGFDDVIAAGDSIIWPMDAVGDIQVQFAWDTYEGGGTIEIEVDDVVPVFGLLAESDTGREGCKRRSVHLSEGSVVKIKVTQDSGSTQTGSAFLEFVIQDPTLDPAIGVVEPEPPEAITDGFTRDGSLSTIAGRLTETGDKTWTITDGSTFPMASSYARAIDPGIPAGYGFGVAWVAAGFADGSIHADVSPIGESNTPAFRNGMVFRYVDNDNFWLFMNYRTVGGALQYYFRSYVAGSISYDSGALTTGARDTGGSIPLEVHLLGTSIIAYYDGVERVNITNSDHLTATKHGVLSYGYGVDYFSAVP